MIEDGRNPARERAPIIVHVDEERFFEFIGDVARQLAREHHSGRREPLPVRPPRPSLPRPTFVYFIQAGGDDGPIKIGSSINVEGRLRHLQTSNPAKLRLLGTAPGGAAAEATLHAQFASIRLHGEWFRPAPELLALIAVLAQ